MLEYILIKLDQHNYSQVSVSSLICILPQIRFFFSVSYIIAWSKSDTALKAMFFARNYKRSILYMYLNYTFR